MSEEAYADAHDPSRRPPPEEGAGLKDHLWRFRNTFTADEAAEIKRIIEEDCERIEDDEP